MKENEAGVLVLEGRVINLENMSIEEMKRLQKRLIEKGEKYKKAVEENLRK